MQSSRIAGFRLSPQQTRLWSLQQGSLAYRVQCVVLIEGILDVERLMEAVQSVSDRHEILRTTFVRSPEMQAPLQVITAGKPTWRAIDLSGQDLPSLEVGIRSLLAEDAGQPFDLERDTPLRASLASLSQEKYLLLLSLPALCGDAATLDCLVAEISRTYAGSQPENPDAEQIQYVQFAEWQNDLQESDDEDAARGRAYWAAHEPLRDRQINLPFERRTSGPTTFDPEVVTVGITPEVSRRIALVAEQCDTSASTFLLACWQSLLFRLSGQPQISTGYVSDGRSYEELQTAVGLFERWLPIQCDFSGDLKFHEVLEQLNRAVKAGREWQDYLTLPATGEAGFALGFEFRQRLSERTTGDVKFTISEQYACTEPFEIKLSCTAADDAFKIDIYYDANVYEREGILRLAGQIETMIRSAVDNPDARVSRLELLSEAERRLLLVEWNDTGSDYRQDRCVHELFEQQAALTPDAVAVKFGNTELTYRELNDQANQTAHYLRKQGVGPDVLVGICMERSIEMVVGLLAILKAGGAYVPLDMTYPKERIAAIVEDAATPVILSQFHLLGSLPSGQAKIICLDVVWPSIAAEPITSHDSGVTPQNLAYVIFTSGSTGKPKGAMIEHRGLTNYLEWAIKTYKVAEGNGSPVHTPIGFDLTITSLYPALLTGRTVVLLPEQEGVEALGDALRTQGDYSLIKITPAHLEVLSTVLSSEEAAGRTRALIIGGEALRWESLAFWQTYAPETRLINEYGPTETVVGCCVYEAPADGCASGPVPIGRPIANTQLYILDPQQQLAAIGMTGELYIGGDGVARGYLNRPELTAEKFIPDPFRSEPGARLYRTGDLVRYLPDGNLIYLGRIDDQVKIRGFRIELGEIETVLAQHPAVKGVAAVVREDVPGDKRLVAYVVPIPGSTPSCEELCDHLARKLPEYMVPSAFVLLGSLPLTANGKVDRKALPAPDQIRPESAASYIAPRTPVEQAVADLWAEVLGVEQIGANSNFFEMGGHSLLATQAITRARSTFQIEVPLRFLFESPTVAGFAEALLQDPNTRAEVERRAQLLMSLSQLSDDELQALLGEQTV